MYMEQMILHTIDSPILPVLLRFFMIRLPENVMLEHDYTLKFGSTSDSSFSLFDLTNQRTTYMDLIVARIHHCNSLVSCFFMNFLSNL